MRPPVLVGVLLTACAAPAAIPATTPSAAFLAASAPAAPTLEVETTIRVVDPSGAPVPGMQLLVSHPSDPDLDRVVGVTGPDGTAHVTVPTGGTVSQNPSWRSSDARAARARADVDVDGLVRVASTWDVPTEGVVPEVVTLTTLLPRCDVEVRFRRADGQALTSWVDLHLGNRDVPFVRLDVARGGRVTLPCDRELALHANGPGGQVRETHEFVAGWPSDTDYALVDTTRPVIELVLAPTHRLRILAHDEAGAPIGGVRVELGLWQTVATTGDDGRATAWVAPSAPEILNQLAWYKIRAKGRQPLEGELSQDPAPAWVQLGIDPSVFLRSTPEGYELDLTLPRSRRVEVRCGEGPASACGVPQLLACGSGPVHGADRALCEEEDGRRVCTCPNTGALLGETYRGQLHPLPDDVDAVDVSGIGW